MMSIRCTRTSSTSRAAMGAIRCAISLAQNPINEVEYKKHYPLLHYPKVHKKGAGVS